MNGISALIKENPESSLTPSLMWGQSEPSDTKSSSIWILNLAASRIVTNEVLC